MRKINYYVATSLDGYIAGKNEDISMFVQKGPGVEKYQQDLLTFDTIIMGRKTYEFGYKYGLTPGQPAYPHLKHFIFSNSLEFESAHPQVKVLPVEVREIQKLKAESGTDIYLCGGGEFAGWLLENKQIDTLTIKFNPIILGDGIRLFGSYQTSARLKLTDQLTFEDGLKIVTYQVEY